MRWIVLRLLKNKAPDSIPRSGDRGRDVNCFTVILTEMDELWVLVDSADAEKINGREWDGNQFSTDIELDWKKIVWHQVQITHYYGLLEISYSGLEQYIRIGLTQYTKLLVWAQRSRQYIYKNQRIAHLDRVGVLRFLVEERVQGRNQPSSAFSVTQAIHTQRVWGHPHGNRFRIYYDMVLQSLEQSGELTSNQPNRYTVSPKALTTLSEFELEERRHNDSHRTAVWVMRLTWVVVIATLVQVGLAVWRFLH